MYWWGQGESGSGGMGQGRWWEQAGGQIAKVGHIWAGRNRQDTAESSVQMGESLILFDEKGSSFVHYVR